MSIEKIKDAYWACYRGVRNIYDIFRYDLWHFFGNLWKWRKVLWEDRDWDYIFILKALEFKVRKTGEHLLEHARHTTYKRDSAQCLRVADALKRIIEDDYCKEEWADYYKKYPINFPIAFKDKEEKALFWLLTKKANRLRIKDEKYFFKTFEKYHKNWWD